MNRLFSGKKLAVVRRGKKKRRGDRKRTRRFASYVTSCFIYIKHESNKHYNNNFTGKIKV